MRRPRPLLVLGLLWSIGASLVPGGLANAGLLSDSRLSARPVEPRDPLVPMVDVRVADFEAEAETLPPQLEQALARDAGLTGAQWLAQAEASAVGIEVVDALRDHIDVRAARLDGLELVVTVGTAAEAAVVESVGARAEIGPAADREGEIEGLEPAADLRGGMPYFFPNGGATFRCSIGFVGLDVVTEEPQIMSAGHCRGDAGSTRTAATITRPAIAGGSIGSPLQTIGSAGLHVTHSYPNPDFPTEPTFYDLGVTTVTGSGWTPKPEVVTWGGSTSGAPLASAPLVIRDAGSALVGTTLCKSGASTGWTCGPITQIDSVQLVGAPSCKTPGTGYCVGSIVATICVRGGDSGGAAVVGTRAVGIVSASTDTSLAVPCNSTNLGVFATLYSGVAAYEQSYKVYPAWEPLVGLIPPTLPTTGVNRFDGPIGGTLTGAGTRHTVELDLDLGGPLTDEVDASGTWSIDLGAVPNGTRSFQLRSTWGAGVQESTATTGRFLKAAAARFAGADRFVTSSLISQYGFPGVPTASSPPAGGSVPVVYLASGLTFPDALSAGPAATFEGGPLLLTLPWSLPESIATELDRLNPEEIVIVGGPSTVSPAVESAVASYTTGDVTRLGGANRFETSRLIAQRMLDKGLPAGSGLWVATGNNFPDALSAGAAAANEGVPILLVNGFASTLDSETSGFINDALQSDWVQIAGSSATVSAGIQSAITNLASTGTVSRQGGADRFETSRLINKVTYSGTVSEVFLAYGLNFPDALSGSVVAGLRGAPLYITLSPCVSPSIVQDVLDFSPTRVSVLGGTGIVSNDARDLKTC